MDRQTTFAVIKAYHIAYRISADLKQRHDRLVDQQRVLLPEIAQAEATENRAREAMLRVIQERDTKVTA